MKIYTNKDLLDQFNQLQKSKEPMLQSNSRRINGSWLPKYQDQYGNWHTQLITIKDLGGSFFLGENKHSRRQRKAEAENNLRRERNSEKEQQFATHVQQVLNDRNQLREKYTPVESYNSNLYKR